MPPPPPPLSVVHVFSQVQCRLKGQLRYLLVSFSISEFSSPLFFLNHHVLYAMASRSTRSSSMKSSTFFFPEDIKNLSALYWKSLHLFHRILEQHQRRNQAKKLCQDPVVRFCGQPDSFGSSGYGVYGHAVKDCRDTVAIGIAQCLASSFWSRVNHTPHRAPSSPVKLQSAILPNASSSPRWNSAFRAIPSLDQLRSKKKAGASLPNNFLFSAKGTVEYDKLE